MRIMGFARRLAGLLSPVCSVIAASLLLTGCGTTTPKSPFAEIPGVTAPLGTATPAAAAANPAILDRIQPSDALIITFSDLPTPTPPIEERVKEDGTITLLLNKSFVAAGKTRGDLEKEIRAAYVPSYFVNMTVSVKIQEQTRFYYVGGEVKAPGRQVYISRITVLKAIQSAGDFTDFANKKAVVLTRADGTSITINCVKAQSDAKLDVEVFPGDKIHVRRKIW
jgi:polysaccharide export outer membrane protein